MPDGTFLIEHCAPIHSQWFEKILREFNGFLQSLLDFYSKGISRSSSKSITLKSNELENFTEDYNARAVARAVEILDDEHLTVFEKEALPKELANAIKE